MTKQKTIKLVSFSVLAALFVSVGWYFHYWYAIYSNKPVKRIQQSGYQFISPLLDVELMEGFDVSHEPIPFKYKIVKFVDQQIRSGNVLDMSVYYRDLSNGPWFGINEKVNYNPASMMKVPLMVAWLKRAEKDPAVLRSTLAYAENLYDGPPQGLPPAQSLKPGVRYTVEELLRDMIQFSDNKATKLLSSAMPDDELDNVIVSMDVASEPNTEPNKITVHGYSGFLRILYNASFLNREMSEKALQLMSHQAFAKGIVAGVPQGTKIASKFGEYWTAAKPDVFQLHEFAIVYHPNDPYILGVLTRGGDMDKQAEIIKDVSKIVYDSVNISLQR